MGVSQTVYKLNINDVKLCETGLSVGRDGSPDRLFLPLGRKPDETDLQFVRQIYYVAGNLLSVK